MSDNRATGLRQRIVDGNEAMRRVDECGTLDTRGAEVPVGAVEALVADAIDELDGLADRP
jgi:hypothetical protein